MILKTDGVLATDRGWMCCIYVFPTNGMFYGFAEVVNWRAFEHFDKSGKSLKAVDATHPARQIQSRG